MIQFEELDQQWRRLDQKLDQSLALQTELVRQVVMQPARRRVNRLAIWPAIDVVFCVGVLLLGAAFVSGHWRDGHLLLPAIVVMISVLALLVDSIRQLERVSRLDWCGPVAEIQNSLERLRVAKIRQFKWIIVLSPLAGFCGFMVGLQWLLEWLSDGRADLLDKLDRLWIAGNYVFGVLFALFGCLVARVLATKCHHHRWWQAVLDGVSGNSLKAATLDVERWASLQQEASNHSN